MPSWTDSSTRTSAAAARISRGTPSTAGARARQKWLLAFAGGAPTNSPVRPSRPTSFKSNSTASFDAMSRNLILSAILSGTAAWIVPSSPAADQAAQEKLHQSLRATMLQLRNAETERANLQAAKTELEAKNKTLEEQVASMSKQAA